MTTDEQAELSALLIALGRKLAPVSVRAPQPCETAPRVVGVAAHRVLRQLVGARAMLDAAADHAEFIIERSGE